MQRNMQSFLIIKDNDEMSNLRRSEHHCRCEKNRCHAIVGDDEFLLGRSRFIPVDSRFVKPRKQNGSQEWRGIELRMMFILHSRSN